MSKSREDAAARRRYHAIPPRKGLPHEVPLWVDPTKEVYFITICCEFRGQNQLARPDTAKALFETIKHRNDSGDWFARLALLMPDHIHLLISFPHGEKPIQTVVSKWKEWTAKKLSIKWERNFFEHRLRKEESVREKADYILANPVRAGLASCAEDWPFVFIGEG